MYFFICDKASPSYHAVMHDFIPIFSRHNTKKNSDSLACCGEIGMPVNRETEKCITGSSSHKTNTDEKNIFFFLPIEVFPIFDSAKENNSSKCIAEE